MDPPDLLSVDLSTSRPTQHLGRVKSKHPQLQGFPKFISQGHCLLRPTLSRLLWL